MNQLNLKKAATTLQSGGVIAYPTEAVYGLGCDPMNQLSVQKILRLKNRPAGKGLILIAASFEQLEPYLDTLTPSLFAKVMSTWPGPTNWLLPPNFATPKILRGDFKLQAMRVSNHPMVQALCKQFGGAIVSTSANVSGRPAATTALQVRLRFSNKLDYILPGEVGSQKKPCEIRNGLNDQLIRAGS